MSDNTTARLVSSRSLTKKPDYDVWVDEWRGKKFDLGLFWIQEDKIDLPGVGTVDGAGVMHPHMIDVMAMDANERREFIGFVRGKLKEKYGV